MDGADSATELSHKKYPGRIRTCDHAIRNRVLYPAELRGRRENTGKRRNRARRLIQCTHISVPRLSRGVISKRPSLTPVLSFASSERPIFAERKATNENSRLKIAER